MKNQIFGGLIEFESQEKLIGYVKSLDTQSSIKVIELSIEYGMKNGLYTLEEAYCLFNCLLTLKSETEEKPF